MIDMVTALEYLPKWDKSAGYAGTAESRVPLIWLVKINVIRKIELIGHAVAGHRYHPTCQR